MLLFSCFNKSYPRHLCQGDTSKINYWFLFSESHFVLLPEDEKKEVFLSSAWKIEKFVLLLQVCRGWNEAFHMPELWRCFEFELNQPASSYLKATHPDLIKQIIKRHSDHLQYVSFKVRKRGGQFEVTAVQWWSEVDFYVLPNSQCHFLCVLPGGQQQRVCRSSVRHPLSAGELFFENSGAHLHSQAQLHGDA